MIETFCLHARALLEFFSKPRSRRNSARSFANGYSPDKEPEGSVKKLNNQVTHFMDGRTADASKKIDNKIRHELLEFVAGELVKFRRHLDVPYRSVQIPDIKVLPLDATYVTSMTVSVSSMRVATFFAPPPTPFEAGGGTQGGSRS